MAGRAVVCEACGGPNEANSHFCRFCQAPLAFARKKSQRKEGRLLGDAEAPALPATYEGATPPPPKSPRGLDTPSRAAPPSPRALDAPSRSPKAPSSPRSADAAARPKSPVDGAAAAAKKKERRAKHPKKECASCHARILADMLFCTRCGVAQESVPELYCGDCGARLVDRATGKAGGGVCPHCQPVQCAAAAAATFARKDERKSIIVDAATVDTEMRRLAQTAGSLLHNARASQRGGPRADQTVAAWADVHVEHEIGEGGYAIVYAARFRGELVAVKELKMTGSEQDVRDFREEVAVLLSLSHPHVTRVIAACDERLAYVMEYCEQGPLSLLLVREDVRLDWSRRLAWLEQMAQACHYLHSLRPKILHRDLKCDNVLVCADNTIRICDFGMCKAKSLANLARRQRGASMMGLFKRDPANVRLSFKQSRMSEVNFTTDAGTPAYMAPELLRRQPFSEKVDTYAFGICFFEMVAREWAYGDMDIDDIVARVRDQNLRPTMPSWCPKPLDSLAQLCWHERADRRPTFAGVLKHLASAQSEQTAWPQPLNVGGGVARE